MSLARLGSLLLLSSVLAACGGGGSDNGPPPNSAPVAANDAATTAEDTAVVVAVLANDTDPDGAADIDPATVAAGTTPAGTVGLNPNTGEITFTPNANFNGPASFTYTVKDKHGNESNAATVSITVNPVNDAPVAANDSATGVEDQPLVIDVLANDSDADGAADLVPSSVTVSGATNGTTTVNASNGRVTFTPAANFNGPTSFSYTVRDKAGAISNAATVSLSFAAVNDPPTISDIPDQSTQAGTQTAPVAFQVGDADGDALSFAVASSNANLVPVENITLGGSGANRTVQVRAAGTGTGSVTITVGVSDGKASVSDSFILTVTPADNVAPVAHDDSATTAEDTPVGVKVLGNDTDADGKVDASSVAIVGTSHGTTFVDGVGTVTFTPEKDYNGAAGFTYTVRDDQGAISNPATVTIDVTAINDAPRASDGTAAGNEDTTITANVNVQDPDSTTLTYTVTQQPAHGTVTISADGSISYVPAANYNGPDSFRYKASDGELASNEATFSLTVYPVNDPPVATAATLAATEDRPFSGRAAATDVENDALTFSKASDPAHGTVEMAGDGTFTYRPALNFAGDDSFTFTATDGTDRSAPATITLSVANTPEAVLSVTNAEGREGGGPMTFTVSLSRAPDGPVEVAYATADGTARAGSDYTAATGVLKFGPDVTTQTVTVPVIDDSFQEKAETFALKLNVSAGAESVEGASTLVATGTITDNDDKHLLRVGAGKHSIQPTQAQIDGILEDRLGGAEGLPSQHLQKFNLGGFGINPLSNIPDDPALPKQLADQCKASGMPPEACGNYVQYANEQLTEPASRRVFVNKKGVAEEEMARAFVIEHENGTRVVFVMFDAVGAGNIIEKNMTAAIVNGTQTCGTSGHDACFAPENVIIGMTHSHTASDLQGLWGGVPQDWIENVLYPGALEAVRAALKDKGPARLRVAVGHNNDYNSYRRPKIAPGADADGHVTLLAATTDEGDPIGSILQYAAHPTEVNEDHDRTPHPDYILGAMDWLERGGGTSLYYNGPIADASGSGYRPGCDLNQEQNANDDGVYGRVRCRGQGIAEEGLKALAANSRELAPTITAAHVEVTIPVTNPGFLAFGAAGSFNRYYDFAELPTDSIPGIGDEKNNLPQLTPTAKTEVSRVTLGGAESGLEIVTIPGEGTNTFGEYIRGLAKTDAMLMGLTHNSFGYIIPEDEFSYVDQEGDDGLVAPWTGYEENVSMGPLTAPILRSQAYNKLFAADVTKEIPPTVADCLTDSTSPSCITQMVQNRISHLIDGVRICIENGPSADGCPLSTTLGYLPFTIPGAGKLPVVVSGVDTQLAPLVAKMEVQGCDILDPSNCLYPFPNDHFTVEAAPGSPQAAENGGTGRRVNLNILATPHNTAGKPVDPTEWNRNDGFSPGALIATYAPGLSLEKTYGLPSSQIGIANIGLSLDPRSPVVVIDATPTLAGGIANPQYLKPQLVWSEKDANANLLTPLAVAEVGSVGPDQNRPLNDGRAALLIRPAKNFAEGHRYIVALRNFKDVFGKAMAPSLGFQACRGDVPSALRGQSPMKERCDHINDLVGTLGQVQGFDTSGLYLAWDFTVASTNSQIGRLRHMRDEAFKTLSHDAATDDCTEYRDGAPCGTPAFTVDKTEMDGDMLRIQGEITVPSFLAPADPAPLDDPAVATALNQLCDAMSADPSGLFKSGCDSLNGDGYGLVSGASVPNRLFYMPADGALPSADAKTANDPLFARYGDGLPDQTGTMKTHYWCRIPAQASPQNPARPGVYGHGLLDRGVAVDYDGVPEMSKEFNFLFCAVDWYGFSTGDLANVASQLVDVSNFPVVPDASQQGILNFMFLARLLRDPHGFASHPAFQDAASHLPRFNGSEVFYDGNSQGGIMGGALIAASKDIHRGSLGSLGMNYSTLLTRSKDFDQFASVLYASYTDPLDRQLLFSMIQMLWDRSENDGYAEHLTDNSAFGGTAKAVKLDPNFGDQQVTMWSADVMARTMGIPVDHQQTLRVEARGAPYVGANGHRHPDLVPYYGMTTLDYDTMAGGGAEIVWDSDNHGFAAIPPITNTPNRAGEDPHDNSAKTFGGRCSKAHFMAEHRLIDVTAIEMHDGGANCPALTPAAPVTAVSPAGGGTGLQDALTAAFGKFTTALGDAATHLANAITNQSYDELVAALDSLLGGSQQLVADTTTPVLQTAGNAAGIGLPVPGPRPAPDLPAPQQLMAGVAKGLIRVPVGAPLGGYLRPPVAGEYVFGDVGSQFADGNPQGAFASLQKEFTDVPSADGCDPAVPTSCQAAPLPDEARKATSPYATYSPPTKGYYDSLNAKAVALFDGHDYVVLVKVDMIGMLDEVVQDVKKDVKARTGKDLGEGLIMSGTHTHDGPGALANDSERYFWLAMDLYQHDLYRRVVSDLSDVVVAAVDHMHPARIGHGDGLDQKGLNHYRRDHLASYADNDTNGLGFHDTDPQHPNDADQLRRRIGVLRVDDAATGQTLALVINWAMHGIAFDVENQYFSGDVLGSIEREVEQSFPAPANAPAGYEPPIAMLVQNTGGDITPDSGGIYQYGIRGIEYAGKKMAPQVRAIADAITNFDDKPDLRSVSQRVILNRERLGYKDDEYPYPWGAAQCGNDIEVPFAGVGVRDIPGYTDSGAPVKEPYCIFAPPPDANDVADNGVGENGAFLPQDTILYAAKIGDITLMVQPGEPLVEYGVELMDMAKGEGFRPRDTFVWGYSGDHIGYILPPNKYDWAMFGGAESTTTFWGWKQGERFIKVSKSLIDALRDGKAAPADEFTVDYSKYRAMYDKTPAAQPTPSLMPGAVVQQPSAIEHFQKTAFSWEGGDPVVDLPRVTMERADGTKVRRANGEVMDTFFEMHLKYRLVNARHQWTVEFEAPKDWLPGLYKFAVTGQAFQGSNAPYSLTSNTFAVNGSPSLQISSPATIGGSCRVALQYAPRPDNYRIVDADTRPEQSAPVRDGTVVFSVNGANTPVSHVAGTDAVYAMPGACPDGLAVHGYDAWGNTSPTVGAQADSDGDGVPDGSDNCPNTPSGTTVDSHGCPVQQAGSGFPLCDPAFGTGYCISDLPGGDQIQQAVDTVYNTLMGGGVPQPPAGGLPDQCAPGQVPGAGGKCLSDLPSPVGDQFGSGGSAGGVENASCATHKNLVGGRSYQVKLTTWDNETLSFQVLEPQTFDCANIAHGAHPVLLDGPGYGGSRVTSGYDSYRAVGYTVISWDPRGFGDSTGSIRVMDPEYEGRYLVQMLDWAEANLDYLSWRDERTGKFVPRPADHTSVAGGVNLVVGSNGGSYGGGYQLLLLTVDAKKRLDALAPDITWHDLRNALNPGYTIKSMWDVALSAVGEGVGHSSGGVPTDDGQDPFIKETLARGAATNEFPAKALDWFHYHGLGHWCGANGLPTMPYPGYAADTVPMLDPLNHDNTPQPQGDGRPGFGKFLVHPANPSTYLKGTSVYLTQGMPDTLFNFNEAWWNYQCLTAAGAEVELNTHNGGHTIPYGQSPDSTSTPADGGSCPLSRQAWFDSKLRGKDAIKSTSVCFDLAGSDTVNIPADKVLAPQPAQGLPGGAAAGYTSRDVASTTVPNGLAAVGNDSGNAPMSVSLGTVQAHGVLAGMPHVTLTVASVSGLNEMAQDCSDPSLPTRTGCDSITFVGIGLKKAGAMPPTFKLVDDQVKPIRGLGTHDIDLVGIAERLEPGDEVALLLYGAHTQFFSSYSRDASLPAVTVTGNVKLPVYAVDANGKPQPDASASGVLSVPAAGGPLPSGGLPDQCAPGQVPGAGGKCLSDLPSPVGDQFGGGTPPAGPVENASCATGKHLTEGRSYQVKIGSDSGETISFQVLEPTSGIHCANGAGALGAHPLILHGHGFGGARSTSGFNNFRADGFTVISFDQRGHNDSSGTIRVMDPDYEGKDLVKIMDWAETNLDYLAYHNDVTDQDAARPAGGVSKPEANLLAGSIGSSYGGGYQLMGHAVDTKHRLHALAPDITWHDLRWSLNPGDVLKSGWDLLLVAGGETGSFTPGAVDAFSSQDPSKFKGPHPDNRGLDPYVREVLAHGVATGEFPREALEWFRYHSPAYWCGLNSEPTMDIGYDPAAGAVDPNVMVLGAAGDVPGKNTTGGQPPVNVLLSQGFRDTLFNFNDAWANYQCLKARSHGKADVRLITHESGHILNSFVNAPGPLNFGNTGTHSNNCGTLKYGDAQLQWFEDKLLRRRLSPELAGTEDAVCMSLATDDAVMIPVKKMLAPVREVVPDGYWSDTFSADRIPEGVAAQQLHMAGQDQPATLPLLTVTNDNGLLVAGIPVIDITVTSAQGANDLACEQATVPTLRTGCDSILFVGVGRRSPTDTAWTLIDDQVRPIRGLGRHFGAQAQMIGISERLKKGDELALMIFGYSPEYPASFARDATLPVVNVAGSVKLPLYAVDANGAPDFDANVSNSVGPAGGGGTASSNNGGVFGMLADFASHIGDLIKAAGNGDAGGVQQAATGAVTTAASDAQHLGDNPSPEGIIGEDEDLASVAQRAKSANREAQAVVITGSQVPDWSAPEARGLPYPYPSGATTSGQIFDQDPTGTLPGQVRNAHNGVLLYPVAGVPAVAGVPVDQIAAYSYKDGAWQEIPVQVDERMPYFLANANSDFSVYSGTDQELTYVWDTESWAMTAGTCERAYGNVSTDGKRVKDQNGHDITGLAGPTQDPVPGLDNDDEIAFMAADAGDLATGVPADVPAGAKGEQVAIADPLDPSKQRFVYLFLKDGGSKFRGQSHYVKYQRDANADQWVDRTFFEGKDPFHRTDIGTSNTGYGANLGGTVCDDGVTPRAGYKSDDRFPRDGVTVSTDAYQWHATGRWMVREMHVAKPGQPGVYGPDLVDRWKGRAFQQSPDTNVSVVGFEDEQVNWEANSSVLGERAGPVRAIREVWGADSGTNVTKTETFYRDAVAYHYHVRVHPIPPDGLYTSWDYNRSAMVSDDPKVPGGRYFTILRPRGVPVDGKNDDIGQVDSTAPIPGIGPKGGPGCFSPDALKRDPASGGIVAPNAFGVCPIFFDAADPTFNLPLAFDNWEQVSGKGNSGSLVYTFENKGPTSYTNPLVVPFYRDDECLDDGTGDDPVARPYPGERSDDPRVIAGYRAANGGVEYKDVPCSGRQGAYGEHGVHYFFTHDSDNAFSPVTSTEIDGQQWQFAVPTDKPKNVAEPYANTVRVPLQVVVTPLAPGAGTGGGGGGGSTERGFVQVVMDFVASIPDAIAGFMGQDVKDALAGANHFFAGIVDLLIGNDHASVVATAEHAANNPTDVGGTANEAQAIVNGWSGEARHKVFAGVGVVDMTPDVGYGAGQYSDKGSDTDGTVDPYATHKSQVKSYGVMSRLTGRAIVVEGSNGKRIALLKSDNYLAQDDLIRRVGQILEENGSSIGYDQILYGVTHAHSTSYYSGSPAVAAFQDVYDPRFFENQARKLASAILIAEHNLKPARMGATTVRHKVFKGQIMHKGSGDDGTPVGYPDEYGDHGLVVMRFDDMTHPENPTPIAVWINWGEHPEGLDGMNLHSADYVAFLERFVERDIGAPMVFSQADVGSSEQSGNDRQELRDDGTVCGGEGASGEPCATGEGTWRDWNHNGYIQNERNARFLADGVVKGFKALGVPAGEPNEYVGGDPKANNYIASIQVPATTDFPVDYRNAWVPGPLSHPYPSVSNCRTEPTAGGDTGVVVAGLPDCERDGVPGSNPVSDQVLALYNQLKEAGVPLPENYDAASFGSLEENLRLKLQAFRLGDAVLASCACEAQVDLILNFESRANDVRGDIYDGFDWACLKPEHADEAVCERQKQVYDPSEFVNGAYVPGSLADPAKLAHMRAEVHNKADGWDSPMYAPYANAEPVKTADIKGNFTKEEVQDLGAPGYKLAVGVGHAGDYNGYTVSYREYMSHDHYRKALTSYGPHTADYMVTRMVRMAAAMHGAPELKPEPHDTAAQADEARMVAQTRAEGAATKHAYEAFYAALPPDLGPAKVLEQPPSDISYYNAATFTWQGGATAIDNPRVTVQKQCTAEDALDATHPWLAQACAAQGAGAWVMYGNQTGEVQTRVWWPTNAELPTVYAGQFAWKWTANFEAYEAFPARLGSVPAGNYRFDVNGCVNDASAAPQDNLMNRVENFFSGILPHDVSSALMLEATGCHGGASAYHLTSSEFQVFDHADLVTSVASDASGALTIHVAAASIPKTYTSVFPYVLPPNADLDSGGGVDLNDDGRFCEQCSFRPWAQSNAAPQTVLVQLDDGTQFEATGSGTNWTATAGLAAGHTATITATYADGRVSRPYMYTRPGVLPLDTDGDGVPDATDNCPNTANPGQEDNDGDHIGNACDATPDGDASGPGFPVPVCAPDQVPGIGGGCISDVDGGTTQGLLDTVYNTVYNAVFGGGTPPPPGGLPSGVPGQTSDPIDPNSNGGKVYQVYLTSTTTQTTIAFSVFEPKTIDKTAGNALVLQGAGYGLKRSHTPDGMAGVPGSPVPTSGAAFGFSGGLTGDMTQFVAANFWVISFDQGGFGESGGNVRIMDPDFDGKDLIQILDWAETNLPHLMYHNAAGANCIPANKTSVAGGCNLVLGSTGGSYGGGYQLMLLAIDDKQRLDAMVPQITWHDLPYSLAPNGVTKSSYAIGLAGLGEVGSQGKQDMFIRTELLNAGVSNKPSQELVDTLRYHSPVYWCEGESLPGNTYAHVPYRPARHQPKVDALIFQGMHDALFTYNEAVSNYECLKSAGGDVRLYTYQFGHAFPTGTGMVTSTPFAFCSSFAECQAQFAGYTGGGTASAGASMGCGPYASPNMELDWMKAKLLRDSGAKSRLASAPTNTCVSLGSTGDAVTLGNVPRGNPGAPGSTKGFDATLTLNAIQAQPLPLKLLTVDTPSLVVAGIPHLIIDIESMGANPGPVVPEVGVDDVIVYVGLARARFDYDSNCANYAGQDPTGTAPKIFCDTVKTAEGAAGQAQPGASAATPSNFELIDDQVLPVRGLGHWDFDMQGIGERLAKGEQLQLVIYGYHPLYSVSGSRQPADLPLHVSGSVSLPLHGDLPKLQQ